MCSPLTPVSCLVDLTGQVASKAADEGLQVLLTRTLEGLGKAIAGVGTLWVNLPSPTLTGTGTTDVATPTRVISTQFETVLSYTKWVALVICIFALIAAGTFLWNRIRRGEGLGATKGIFIALGGAALISGSTSIAAMLIPSQIQGTGVSAWLQGQTMWWVGGLAVISVIVGAVRMVVTGQAEAGRDLMLSLLKLLAVSGAGLSVISLLMQSTDRFSVWILNSSTDCAVDGTSGCFGENVGNMLALSGTSPLGVILVLFAAFVAMMASVFQIILFMFRSAILVVLAGTFPIAASITNTEVGKSMFQRYLTWLLAWMLFKPAAALCYAAAFRMFADGDFTSGDKLLTMLGGIALMIMALVALPALMKTLLPAAAPLASGMSAAGAAALIAGGGMALQSMFSGGGSDSASGGGNSSGGGQSWSSPTPSGGGSNEALDSNSPSESPSGGTDGGGAGSSTGGGKSGGLEDGGLEAGGESAGGGAAGGSAAGGAATGGALLIAEEVQSQIHNAGASADAASDAAVGDN